MVMDDTMETSEQHNRVLISFLIATQEEEAVYRQLLRRVPCKSVWSRRRVSFYSRSINPHRKIRRSTEIRLLDTREMYK